MSDVELRSTDLESEIESAAWSLSSAPPGLSPLLPHRAVSVKPRGQRVTPPSMIKHASKPANLTLHSMSSVISK